MTNSDLKTRYPCLFQFFAGYFHEDWALDHASANDVTELFLEYCGKQEAAQILKELILLDRSSPTEEALRKTVFSLGSYYDVTSDNMTFREWIERLQKRFSVAYQ